LPTIDAGCALADRHLVNVSAWLSNRYSLSLGKDSLWDAVIAAAHANAFHPVREFLNGLAWDGKVRLPTWAAVYLGAKGHEEVGRWWLISAVARVFEPGCQVDHMLTLEGPQGARKSSALAVLAGDEWFTDQLEDVRSKDACMQLRGRLIVEVSELAALGRSEREAVKAFLTRRVDKFRPPYGRSQIEAPRQCVFAGTTNEDTYLQDDTGDRRYWPLRCGRIDLDGLRGVRDQLWAEAVEAYRSRAAWWPETTEQNAELSSEQDARRIGDPWETPIVEWLASRAKNYTEQLAYMTEPCCTTTSEVLGSVLDLPAGQRDRRAEMRVAAILRRAGWTRGRHRVQGVQAWRFVFDPLAKSAQWGTVGTGAEGKN
jgi:predicted P-loop ATPase